jgi:S-adenosylmethionine hydrolase
MPDRMSGTVVFVTDFGLEDGYAAELRAAAWRADPGTRCVDGTHLVAPGDVVSAAYACKRLARAFGAGTAICAVVDPGVGSDRPALAVECDGVFGVAPDTGLLTYLWTEAAVRRAVRLPPPAASDSATFHGRDLFAPLAARLAGGAPLGEAGTGLDEPVLRHDLLPTAEGIRLRAMVVSVDRFGNCVTGVRSADLGGGRVTGLRWAGGGTDRTVRTYAEIGDGVALLWNSAGHLELAARETSAAAVTGLDVGAPVQVELG